MDHDAIVLGTVQTQNTKRGPHLKEFTDLSASNAVSIIKQTNLASVGTTVEGENDH